MSIRLRTLFAPAALLAGGATSAYALFGGFAAGLPPEWCPAPAAAAAAEGKPAPDAPVIVAEGRLEAYPDADVWVGAEVAGLLEQVPVFERQSVRRGELLAELRAEELRAELAEIAARAGEVAADIRLYELELHRQEQLAAEGVVARAVADHARRNLEAAQARRHTLEAQRARVQSLLDKTRVVAPIDGLVVERRVDRGETVHAGDALLRVVDLSRLRVAAEVDEFDAGRVALGQAVTVTAEGHDGRSWNGVVEEIPEAVALRGLKPQDPTRPTDARVLVVKIRLTESVPLKLGQRVEVRPAAPPPAQGAGGSN